MLFYVGEIKIIKRILENKDTKKKQGISTQVYMGMKLNLTEQFKETLGRNEFLEVMWANNIEEGHNLQTTYYMFFSGGNIIMWHTVGWDEQVCTK